MEAKKGNYLMGLVLGGIIFVFCLQAHWSWAGEVCESGPGEAQEACQISQVEAVFDSVENRAPRNYQAVIGQLKKCSTAIGKCFKNCENTTVTPNDSLSSLVKTLQNSLGKPPKVKPLFECREILKSFSNGLENSCDLRQLKTKLVLEKSAQNIRPLLQICQAMGKMETVAYEGASPAATDVAITSESVPEIQGNFEPIRSGDPSDENSIDDGEESSFEPVVSVNDRAAPEKAVNTSRTGGRPGYSGSGVGGTPDYRPEKATPSPFGSRASSRRQKIPSHGLSPQERMAKDMEMYSGLSRKKNRKHSPPKAKTPLRLRTVDIPLKKAPADQSIWEIHHKAFEDY